MEVLRCFWFWCPGPHKYVLVSESIRTILFCLYGLNRIAQFFSLTALHPFIPSSTSRCRMHLIWGTIEFPVFDTCVWEWKRTPRNTLEVVVTKGPRFEWLIDAVKIRSFSA
jgi:hypothetical protein